MGAERIGDDHVDRVVGHRAGARQPAEGRVRDQMGVAVKQRGQHRAGVLPHLDA